MERGAGRGHPAGALLPCRLHPAEGDSSRSPSQLERVVFDILFRTVAETLRTIAADPLLIGARVCADRSGNPLILLDCEGQQGELNNNRAPEDRIGLRMSARW